MWLWLGAAASITAALMLFWLWNFIWVMDVEEATEETANEVFSVATGVVASGVVIAGEFAMFLGEIGTLLTTSPSTLSHLFLAVLGYATLDGLISLQPETWALVVIAALFATFMMRG